MDPYTSEIFFKLCASQGYARKPEKNGNNSSSNRVDNFRKSVNF